MGLVHIYCGDGKGKTTAAVGLCVRAAGSGMKVLFVQFFKNGNSGEIEILKNLENVTCLHSKASYERYLNMNDKEKIEAKKSYSQLLLDALNYASSFDMLVLDEVISAYYYDMVDHRQLLDFIKSHKDLEIVLTGRNPDKELQDQADYISNIASVKHPFEKGIKARKGIEF